MTERPEDPTTTPTSGAGGEAGADDAIVDALRAALEHRAGGPMPEPGERGSAGPVAVAPDDRLVAIEAGIGSTSGTPRRRTFAVAGLAAAAVLVLVVATVSLLRPPDDASVESVAGDPTTTRPTVPETGAIGSGTTLVTDPTATTVDPSSSPTPTTSTPTTRPPTTAATPLDDATLVNMTFPLRVCSMTQDAESAPLAASEFTLVDGEVFVHFADPEMSQFGYRLRLEGTARGDLTGDGVEDAVVHLSCGLIASDGVSEALVLVSRVDGQPTVLAVRTGSGAPKRSVFVDSDGTSYDSLWHETITSVDVVDGRLVVRWHQRERFYAEVEGPRRDVTVTYGFEGTELVPLGESDVVDTPGPQVVPVEGFDFTGMTLALDRSVRDHRRAACHRQFQDVSPVDAVLVGGSGIVRDQAGNEIGSVAVESVMPANLDGDADLEALVRIGCTRGGVTVSTAVVYEAALGAPELVWSTASDLLIGWDEVESVDIREGTPCPLFMILDHSVLDVVVKAHVDYRRVGDTYELVSAGGCQA